MLKKGEIIIRDVPLKEALENDVEGPKPEVE